MMIAPIAVILTVALILVILTLKRKSRAKALTRLDELMPDLDDALSAQESLLDFSSGYLMKKDWDALCSKNAPLLNAILSLPEEIRQTHPRHEDLERFAKRCSEAQMRTTRNEAFKSNEISATNEMLSNVNGKSLDAQQRDAVVTDEYNNLVIAGAGSGKTLTVVGKIKYLVERWGVQPEKILVTSFTCKSANELSLRIEKAGIAGVSCKTFHKIGLDTLGEVGVANENELTRCVVNYLRKEIHAHPDQVSAYIEFYGCYRHLPRDYSEYETDGKRMEELKATDLTTIKGQLDTLNGERVKSLEELMIANFLFMHGVNYEYESVYPGEYDHFGRAYQPDFYLPDYDIYLEHFGVNENGRCPWIETAIEEQKYLDGIVWKREVHAKNGTRLIESYSYWNKDHDLLNKVGTLLESNGVALVEDKEMLASVYGQLSQDNKHLRSITALITTFLSLAKANGISMAEVADRGRETYRGDGYMWHRFELFMSFVEPIMALYQQTLSDKGQIDFDDMINLAADKINREGSEEYYSHIIVDEYQDISKSRFNLIKAIRDACEAKLLCVGDDWQSIYRFAGSDVSLFTDFAHYVGYHETMKIERTYRNSQELVDIATAFIERNPLQIHKKMRSDKHEQMPVVIAMKESMAEGLESALDSILSRENYSGRILVLGRHNFDIETAYPDFRGCDTYESDCMFLKRDRRTSDVRLTYRGYANIIFMSVHRAKGLEADDVVVLNLQNAMYGFPNRIEDDPILQILLGHNESFEFAEERRLFYVAITRTKQKVYLVAGSLESGGGPSPFVEELKEKSGDYIGIKQKKGEDLWHPTLCPRCGTGRLVVRTNSQTGKSFLGCTNYPLCEKSYSQTEIIEDRLKCPSCGGWMVRRKREDDGTPFFGCSNFPNCSATIDAGGSFSPGSIAKQAGSSSMRYGTVAFHGSMCEDGAGEARSEKCPKCGSSLRLIKNSKDGSLFYGCVRYPSCRYTRNAEGEPSARSSRATKCPRCGAPLKELTNRKDGSVFYGCTRFPKCKFTRSK